MRSALYNHFRLSLISTITRFLFIKTKYLYFNVRGLYFWKVVSNAAATAYASAVKGESINLNGCDTPTHGVRYCSSREQTLLLLLHISFLLAEASDCAML